MKQHLDMYGKLHQKQMNKKSLTTTMDSERVAMLSFLTDWGLVGGISCSFHRGYPRL